MNCVFIDCDGEVIRINLDNNASACEHLDILREDLIDEETLPPLVEVDACNICSLAHDQNNNTKEEKSNQPNAASNKDNKKLFKMIHLKEGCTENRLPHLVDVVTGDIVQEPAPEPVVYKTLVAQGETIQLPQDIVREIPYIDTLFSGRFVVNEEDGAVQSNEIDPSLLKVIIRYLTEKKLYILLGCLPKSRDLFQLLELYHFLAIASPIKTTAEEIRNQLLLMPSVHITSQKDLVEFAFLIFHAYPLINYKKERKIRDMVFNTIMYIFKKESQSFKPRAKSHLLRLAKKCVWFSYNQFEKIKKLRVKESFDNSDSESVGPVFDELDSDCEEFGYDLSDEFSDSDDLAMLLEDTLSFDMYSGCYDYSDYEDDEYNLLSGW